MVLGIAGIAGTLAAALGSALIQSHRAKVEQIRGARLDAYVDLIRFGVRTVDNAQKASFAPSAAAELPEFHTDELLALDARIRLLGSPRVREAADTFTGLAKQFARQWYDTLLSHRDETASLRPELMQQL